MTDDTYVIVGDDGQPLGVTNMTMITDEGTKLAFAFAAHCDDAAALDRIQTDTLTRVGPDTFGYVCANALRTLAEHILSPSFDVAQAHGTDLRAGMRAIAQGEQP
ncbi:hypothetical protein [Micromonospora sp. NPDC126480]|uniref:hypothetical protein n=1 Tax=Micromonospora sp. NPDC126480 TaxID=3155312 RepID=UPI003329D0BA